MVVFLLTRQKKNPEKRFNLPYINGQWVVPVVVHRIYIWLPGRLIGAVTNLTHESHQEILFLIFILITSVIPFSRS